MLFLIKVVFTAAPRIFDLFLFLLFAELNNSHADNRSFEKKKKKMILCALSSAKSCGIIDQVK
jgi:hypothetical protein